MNDYSSDCGLYTFVHVVLPPSIPERLNFGDNDQDGIMGIIDLDDDNDGILDSIEGGRH